MRVRQVFKGMQYVSNLRQTALILVILLGLVGLGSALYELFSPESGTTGTVGAILVTVSTTLLAIAAALLLFIRLPGWLGGLLLVLLLIDAFATAAAGYFLMADFLVAAMIGCLIAGLFAAAMGRRNEKAST